MFYGQIAQSVEQWTENPRVDSSILSLATISKKIYKLLFYLIKLSIIGNYFI